LPGYTVSHRRHQLHSYRSEKLKTPQSTGNGNWGEKEDFPFSEFWNKIKFEKQVSDGLDGQDSIPATDNKLFCAPQLRLIRSKHKGKK
jgi:hypothetical protein